MGRGNGIGPLPPRPTLAQALEMCAQLQTAYFEEKQDRKDWGGDASTAMEALRRISEVDQYPSGHIARKALDTIENPPVYEDEEPEPEEPWASATGIPEWTCGNGHTFQYNRYGQGWGIPTHCFEERTDEEFVEEYGEGEPCLDSSTLDAANDVAIRACREWVSGADNPPEWLDRTPLPGWD